MTNVSVMAESAQSDVGAPVAKDAIDPELVKLSRKRPKIGVITAAGLVFLCIGFLIKLGPDRRFGMGSETAQPVAIADVLSGKIADDSYVSIDAQPLVAHAIRTAANEGGLGMRMVPARGTDDRLWIAIGGDGWDAPAQGSYKGRLRPLDKLAVADAMRSFIEKHPRPVFATAEAVKAASGKVALVGGGEATVADGDKVAYDVVDSTKAVIVGALNDNHPNPAAWKRELAAAGITVDDGKADTEQVKFEITQPDAVKAVSAKLEAAKLFPRVEPVTTHHEGTYADVKKASLVDVDLVGLYVQRTIPSDAYALLTTDVPADYWYMLPITIGVALIGLIFAWALVRAVRRDLLPPRAA